MLGESRTSPIRILHTRHFMMFTDLYIVQIAIKIIIVGHNLNIELKCKSLMNQLENCNVQPNKQKQNGPCIPFWNIFVI